MKDVLFWELKRRRTTILWWTIGSVLLVAVILMVFPSIRDQAAQLDQVINKLPESVRGLKAGGNASVSLDDPVSFLNSQVFYATLPILWIILAITRGAGVLGREEQNHTLELLLARPLSRTRLLAAKALSLMTEFAIVAGATLLVIIALAPVFELHVGTGELALATLYTAAFSLSFGYIAFVLQAANRFSKRAAVTFAVLFSFGGYVLASLSAMASWLEWPVKFMPYHYFRPLDAFEGHWPHGALLYMAIVFILGTVFAVVGFRRRDIE
jgi:ABC-2 type transport system permease protein